MMDDFTAFVIIFVVLAMFVLGIIVGIGIGYKIELEEGAQK